GDSGWNSGEIVAPGGGSATSPVGTTQNAGGTAPSGTGTQSGGGSGGTSTAASGTAPGEPNGAGGSSQVTSLRPGGGGRSTATGFADGSPGAILVSYPNPITANFAHVVGQSFTRNAGATAHPITVPAGEAG